MMTIKLLVPSQTADNKLSHTISGIITMSLYGGSLVINLNINIARGHVSVTRQGCIAATCAKITNLCLSILQIEIVSARAVLSIVWIAKFICSLSLTFSGMLRPFAVFQSWPEEF